MKARAPGRLCVGGPGSLSLAALGLRDLGVLKHGREFKPAVPGPVLPRGPAPDLHPAVVGALWRFGKVQDSDIAATLMDLADKGVIRMEPVVETTAGVLRRQGRADVRALDRPRARRRSSTGLDASSGAHPLRRRSARAGPCASTTSRTTRRTTPRRSRRAIQGWKDDATARGRAARLLESAGDSWQVGLFVLAGAVAVIGVFAAFCVGGARSAMVAAARLRRRSSRCSRCS